MNNSKVGIIILNYMTYDLTIKCLNNLNSMKYENFFVVVVDNASPNNSYDLICKYVSEQKLKYEVYLIRAERNGGYSYGNNLGIRRAEDLGADYIMIMNNDVFIPNDCFLNKMVDILDKNINIAMVGPGVVQKKELVELPLRFQRPVASKWLLSNILLPFAILLNKYLRRRMQSRKSCMKVYAVSGCCFFARTSVLKKIGYFDEDVFLYGEELILGEQLYKEGYDVYFVPDLLVYHNHSATISSVYDYKKIGDLLIKSHMLYFSKYRKDVSKAMRFMIMCSEYVREKMHMPLIILMKNGLKYFKKLKCVWQDW
ncbi:MAG TPA: hypothetical protein DER56_01080 [Thermosipho africanus]|jgi:GT2 family glycosyltransferase|nr:hypothetical protein [Thermosipho africanus]